MKVTIRQVKYSELNQILNLVKELAEFELEPEAVTATLKDYQSSYNDGIFDCTVALLGNKIIGMTLYYKSYSTWKGKMLYLEDFVVKKEYRGKGIGEQLFEALIAFAKKENFKLLKWQVLDWNKKAQNFYKKYNAIIEKNWWNGKLFV